MSWFSGKFTGPINFYSMYNGARCMNDYASYKSDIEHAIDNFEKNTSGNYYKEWEKLHTYITEKNNSLNECYRDRYIKVSLIEDDKIKNFMNRCSKNRGCNNRPRQTQRTTSSNPETKGSCKGPNDCKETAKPKEAKHQTKPTAAVVASISISSSRQNSDDQGQSHAAVPGPRTGSVNSKTETSIDHSVPSVIADTQAPEQRDNTHSGVSGQKETQAQSALLSPAEKENVVDLHLSNASSQGISDGGSPSTGTLPLEVLETNKHEGGPLGSKDLSGKTLDEHGTGVECVEGKTTSDKNCAKTSRTENLSEGTPARGENGDGHSPLTVANSVDTDRTAVLSGDSVTINVETVHSGQVHSVLVAALNRDADPLTSGGENSRGVDDESKAAAIRPTEEENPNSNDAVENPRSAVTQEQKVDTEAEESKQRELPETCQHHKLGEEKQLHICTPQNQEGYSPPLQDLIVSHESNIEKSTPIDDDLLKKIKSYIIMTLIPLAIFLLLTLLIKCTPLGTLFTKKKEKKRKQMNEKLQRVLVEPSNAREERNIQFAYSAFEYSK